MITFKLPPEPAGCLYGEILVNGICRFPEPKHPPERCAPTLPIAPNPGCANVVTPPAPVAEPINEGCPVSWLPFWIAVFFAWACP